MSPPQADLPKEKQTVLGLYLTAREAWARCLAEPEQVKLIDVRTHEELLFVGHAPLAWKIPAFAQAYEWDAGKGKFPMTYEADFVARVRSVASLEDTLLVMCRSGGRSALAVNLLAQAGFTRVHNVVDGMEGDTVNDPESVFHGQRLRNGWKNSGCPWTYRLTPDRLILPGGGGEAMNTEELKAKAKHEFIEYWINVAWLALVFAAFTVYRRQVLAAHDIVYANYWVAVVEALVLGKVIMFHPLFRLGRRIEALPLIVPSLFKTAIFTVVVAFVKALEHGLKGLWHGVGFSGGLVELAEKWPAELLPNGLVVLVALLPFFMVKELGRVLGEKTIRTLFFLPRSDE